MRMTFEGVTPTVAEGVFIAPGAYVVGDVVLEQGASVWFNTVIRGDVGPIRVGARSNIQDGSVVHVTDGKFATHIGCDVTVGHGAIVHGCTLGDGCLIGMGATVLDGAEVGAFTLVGAGSVVTPGTRLPSGVLAVGIPARPKRDLTEAERAELVASAVHYVAMGTRYLAGCVASEP